MKYKVGDLIYASTNKVYIFITDVRKDAAPKYFFYAVHNPEFKSFMFAVDIDNNKNFIKV